MKTNHLNNSDASQAMRNIIAQIESELGWGNGKSWSGSDFERLSDLIFDKTGQRISVSTLKRSWGRTSQSVQPSTTTLNILASFLGAESWRDYSSSNSAQILNQYRRSWMRSLSFGILGLLGLIFLFSLYGAAPDEKPLDLTKCLLTVDKVTNGIPNTVIFRYDLGGQEVDSLELQQSWDSSKRMILDPNQTLVTTTYMTPGYYNAKLIADGEIIKTHNVYLPSEGFDAWVSLKEQGRLQIPNRHWQKNNGQFSLNKSFYEYYNEKSINSLILLNLLPEPVVTSESFKARVKFKLEEKEIGDACHAITIVITGSDNVYVFNLGVKGCSGNFWANLAGKIVDGRTFDLSALGFQINEWSDLNLIKDGSKLVAEMNQEQVVLGNNISPIGLVGGIRFFTQQGVELEAFTISNNHLSVDLMQ